MLLSLDVRRARKGDCMLLHFGADDGPSLAIVDGGPARVYGPHLKPRLEQIRSARRLDAADPLQVDLVLVSHVDDDHINGILQLTAEVLDQAVAVRIAELWHNSFDDIVGNKPHELVAAMSGFGAASLEGDLPPGVEESFEDPRERETAVDVMKVLAGIAQGRTLRGDASRLGIELNAAHDGKLIVADPEPLPLVEGVSVRIVGPRRQELEDLQEEHDAWLEKHPDVGPAALAAYVDDSVANLSSIVLLVQGEDAGRTRSILLTGDARGDNILLGLEETGVVPAGGRIAVDVLKVPHHGSARNLEKDFFERIPAMHYVFSGNGEHGNPERESVEMLLDARGDAPFVLHFTYPLEVIDAARAADWEKERQKRIRKGKPPGPVWSPHDQGLVELLQQRPLKAGQEVRVVDESRPHVIDLFAPLGF